MDNNSGYKAPRREPNPLVNEPPKAFAPSASEQVLWFAQMLDELDQGVLLLDAALDLQHANHAARRQLSAAHPLQVRQGRLQSRTPADEAPLHNALQSAMGKGLRRMLTLGAGATQTSLAVVPLTATDGSGVAALMVVLGKRQVCGDLAVQWFSSIHSLTSAESRVLSGLCAGARPGEIADTQGVSLNTVRSQISSVRAKAGADSICELIRHLAMLPPLMPVLRGVPITDAASGPWTVPGCNRHTQSVDSAHQAHHALLA